MILLIQLKLKRNCHWWATREVKEKSAQSRVAQAIVAQAIVVIMVSMDKLHFRQKSRTAVLTQIRYCRIMIERLKSVQLIKTKNIKVILMRMGIPHLSTHESLVLMKYQTRLLLWVTKSKKKLSPIIQRDKIKSVSRNRCCRFFSACDKKKAQSLVNVAFDGLNSVFQNTNLVLMLRRYSLSIFMHSSEPASSNLIIFVGSGMLVVDIFDTIAHFSISNHNRYRKKTDAELSEEPLSPWVVQLGALACAFSCSLNRIALPITIATIAESVSGAKVDDVPYLNIALFALTAVFSIVHIWSARASYDVAYKHLSGESEEADKPCPCC